MYVELDENGAALLIKIELPTYPDKPPLRWQHLGHTTATLKIRLIGVSELQIRGWTTHNSADIVVNRVGNSVEFRASGNGLLISANSVSADVCRIEGYHRRES